MRAGEFRERPAEEVAGLVLDLFLKGVGKRCAAPPGAPPA